MKIQVVSDLHLEFADVDIKNADNSDVLVLAGDIITAAALEKAEGHTLKTRYTEFFDRVSKRFKYVILVAGNHEYYGGKLSKTVGLLTDFCNSKYENVHFLDNEARVFDGVIFIGGTLWTNLNKGDPITMELVRGRMNDYRAITYDVSNYRKLSPKDTVIMHNNMLSLIRSILLETECCDKIVVVSHHAPSLKSIAPEYAGDYHMNGAFASDLSELILDNPKIKLWCHGHTHNDFDYMLGETRVVCNPRGYANFEIRAYTWLGDEKVVEI